MAWRYRARKGINLLPFLRLNINQSGAWSFTWHVGPWSFNTRTGQHRVDTPGPGSFVSSTRKQRERKRADRADSR